MADEVLRVLTTNQFSLNGKSVLITQYTDLSPFSHTFLAQGAKEGKKILLISFCQPSTVYHNIGSRLGWNSQLLQSRDRFLFMDGLAILQKDPTLGALAQNVEEILSMWSEAPVMLLVDRLDCLFLLGATSAQVFGFFKHCRDLIKGKSTLVTSLELAAHDQQLSNCATLLSHWSDLVMVVKGLETGVSKDLTGRVTIHWSHSHTINLQHFHFKSFDRGVRMFAPGLAVLWVSQLSCCHIWYCIKYK